MRKPNPNITPAVIYRVAELFVDGQWDIPSIANSVNKDFHGLNLTRQSIYKLISEARKLGYIRLVPPLADTLEKEITETFRVKEHGVPTVTVVDCPRSQPDVAVAAAAADVARRLIKDVAPNLHKRSVGLGLGPGRATRQFSQCLGGLMQGDTEMPKVNLFGISSGCPADSPQYAPVSFFNLFPEESVEEAMSLFTQPLIRSGEKDKIMNAFEVDTVVSQKENIDIVATSMGNMEDVHAIYRVFMKRAYENLPEPDWLKECVGDVQYRPFSKDGPIKEADDDFRLVTLFEIDELVSMAGSKDKYVILMARKCALCQKQKTRAKSLLPILTNPKLRFFTHLVMDSDTATEVLVEYRKMQRARKASRKKAAPALKAV